MSDATPSPVSADRESEGFRVVQRTLMRADQELDVRSLYLAGVSGFSGESTA